MAASKTGGADHDDLQQLRNRSRTLMIMERNDTWHHLINSTITTTAPCLSPTVGIIDPKPHQEYANIFLDFNSTTRNGVQENGESCFQESPTLELFPLRSENDEHGKEAQIIGSESMDTPYQFFEFLPLKN
ncbi:hypothetical protein Leryth_006084 [Lithospermum erythrorhizon]|nr:hypothetical protein Leryth_006084 [Lithospermum erythrorhizon]